MRKEKKKVIILSLVLLKALAISTILTNSCIRDIANIHH
jgi:hypothetical protein